LKSLSEWRLRAGLNKVARKAERVWARVRRRRLQEPAQRRWDQPFWTRTTCESPATRPKKNKKKSPESEDLKIEKK
jgi:hypothetical protein